MLMFFAEKSSFGRETELEAFLWDCFFFASGLLILCMYLLIFGNMQKWQNVSIELCISVQMQWLYLAEVEEVAMRSKPFLILYVNEVQDSMAGYWEGRKLETFFARLLRFQKSILRKSQPEIKYLVHSTPKSTYIPIFLSCRKYVVYIYFTYM